MFGIRVYAVSDINLLYAPLTIPLVYCHINSFRRVFSLARPSPGGEKRTAVWASRPEDLWSAWVVFPHVFDYMVVPDRGVVRARCNPLGAAVDAGLDAAARARRAERAVDGGVLYVPQALHVSPSAPPIHAQRVARFDHYRTRNCLPPKKLRRDIQ
jgi:hypothetical protein